jgi:hypothetical protein
LVAVLPHDRRGRFKLNADAGALVDISALGGYSTDNILGGQYRCHVAATLTGTLPSHAIVGVNRFSTASLQFTGVIPEIDIWRAANLMLKRYGEKAFEERSMRPNELAAGGDRYRRILISPDPGDGRSGDCAGLEQFGQWRATTELAPRHAVLLTWHCRSPGAYRSRAI